jgi:hypothetical protein
VPKFIASYKNSIWARPYNSNPWGHCDATQLHSTTKVRKHRSKVGIPVGSSSISNSHLKHQLTALDVLVVLGSKPPEQGSREDFNHAVIALARGVTDGFQLSAQQLRQLRAVDPSPDAMTHQVSPQIREDWTIAMLILGGAPQFGDQTKIQSVGDMVIEQGRRICQQYGISLAPAVAGLREASQLVGSSR